jgi:hypothetical protein
LSAIRQKYRFALLTNAIEPRNLVNRDIEPGGFRPIRLQDPPFGLLGAIVLTCFEERGFLDAGREGAL